MSSATYFSRHFFKCLKITEKVSFNIASEASYVYISSGQKVIKNAKIGLLSLRSISVTRQVNFDRTKTGTKFQKLKCDIFGNFQAMCFYDYFQGMWCPLRIF